MSVWPVASHIRTRDGNRIITPVRGLLRDSGNEFGRLEPVRGAPNKFQSTFVRSRRLKRPLSALLGHSAFAAGMALPAPHLPFAIPVRIGSIGWRAVIRTAPVTRYGS